MAPTCSVFNDKKTYLEVEGRHDNAPHNPETWTTLCFWVLFVLCRCDGTPIGTRVLDLVARVLFWIAGMADGSVSSFRRARWDAITSIQLTKPSPYGRDVRSTDEFVPGEPNIPVRVYAPAGTSGGDAKLVIIYFHGIYLFDYFRFRHVCLTIAMYISSENRRYQLISQQGGGMVIQSEKSTEAHSFISQLVQRLDCFAYSVGYRLAPENPFPCALRFAFFSSLQSSHGRT